jgi:hypothetical protein
MTTMVSKMEREAAVILKQGPIRKSSVLPCSTNMVVIWLYTADITMLVTHTGSSRTMLLSSSTRVTVHSLQGSGFIMESRHLSCSVCSSLLLPSMAALPSADATSCRREGPAGTGTRDFLQASMATCSILVSRLPLCFWNL